MVEPLLWAVGLLGALSGIFAYDWRAYRSLTEPDYPIWMIFGFFFCFIGYLFFVARLGGVIAGIQADHPAHIDYYINSWSEAVALVIGYVVLVFGRSHLETVAIDQREKELESLGQSNLFRGFATSDDEQVFDKVMSKAEAQKFADEMLETYSTVWALGKEPPGTGIFGFFRVREVFLQILTGPDPNDSHLWFEGVEQSQFLHWTRPSFCQYEILSAPRSFVHECIEKFHDLSNEEFLEFFKNEGAGRVR